MTDKDLEIQRLRREVETEKAERIKAQAEATFYRRQIDFLMETYVKVVPCALCESMSIEPDGVRWCNEHLTCIADDAFCSKGKRKTNA